VADGAMGTMLQSMGLLAGELPETLNITDRESIIKIHRKYVNAGSKVITTNTFGANELKLKKSGFSVEKIIEEAVLNAKSAAKGRDVLIAQDIGPIGELLEPMGTLSFEKAYEIFKRQIVQGVKCGVDLILIETMTDLYEAKAAVLAAKENSSLPVLCTMSFEKNGRTFTGCSAESMVMVLQGLGVDALGINCSLGPCEIEPILDEILAVSKIPVMVQPNAGLPSVCNGKTVFNVSPQEFAAYANKFAQKGVRIIGGCCGTTDEYIKMLSESVGNVEIPKNTVKPLIGICTPTTIELIDEVKVIGERINPTGKKLFKEALLKGNMDYILNEAITQVDAGADILDVNVGLPEINEEEMMVRVVKEIQSILDIPLQIDSNKKNVIEKALRVYNGKAIVNSVNGEDRVLDDILPVVKKYGASVVGLTLDEKGIPESAEERFKIAEKIVKKAAEYGIDKEDIYIDCLTLTAAAQQNEVRETVRALSMVKERLNVKTVLGVSNVSFGLPNRELLNRTFLSACLAAGLDLPIINPKDKAMMDTVNAYRVLWNKDKGAADYIEYYKDEKKISVPVVKTNSEGGLYEVIIKGMKDEAENAARKLLESRKPMEIINEYIIPALDSMGEKYEKGIVFLPQLIQSAETVKKSLEIIKERLKSESVSEEINEKILLATVKGDIHDIGKNIVKVLLENYGYDVIDLGKDVPPEKIVLEASKNNVKLIGLSALMTTTVTSMEETIKQLRKSSENYRIMVGGAVLNKEYSQVIGSDYYAKDAREAVAIARKVFEEYKK
jgi:5-methyltetrahydrofolate--homocysteine methyltransferase